DKQVIGQVAADLRAYRRPEPYKGKGFSSNLTAGVMVIFLP
ncbi:hypothetical protein O5853_29380, partial [Escherichia coli]|nr:hypothetical protein [Escherichia coli]